MRYSKEEKGLTSLHYQVYNYLKVNCVGENNTISMSDLALHFDITSRKVREIIKDLTESENIYTVIASTSKGYYLPSNEVEMDKANMMLKSRLKGAMERYFANTPNDRDWIYNLIAELKQKYDNPPQAQQVLKFNGWEKDINYFGERKDQKAYDSLFEFSET